MKVKKIPMRTCVVTKESFPKRELLRVVRQPDGSVVIDLNGKINGRGAYIKKDIAVYEKARKSRILDKKLECNISDEVYDEIKEICEK